MKSRMRMVRSLRMWCSAEAMLTTWSYSMRSWLNCSGAKPCFCRLSCTSLMAWLAAHFSFSARSSSLHFPQPWSSSRVWLLRSSLKSEMSCRDAPPTLCVTSSTLATRAHSSTWAPSRVKRSRSIDSVSGYSQLGSQHSNWM
uniref:Putative secreted protein n=1 Tax=Ixodes ricinus TaxID=34613 RepID=A0A6B0UTS7_IXORI